jgi:hypothetical protein
MISAESAISIFRRDLTVGVMLRGALYVAAMACLAVNMLPLRSKPVDGTLLLMGVGMVWVLLSYRSMRGQRLAAESTSLIASGQFDEAESQIEQALRSFSISSSPKVLSLHHLALLRHAQKRWQETAALCRALLNQKLGTLRGLGRPSRLLLADALLELGDLTGAHAALASLYDEHISLGEAVNLLAIQLDYEARIGAWEAMLPKGGGATYKRVQLAELMPAESSARSQALLALAAQKTNRTDWAEWLRRRAELLEEPGELIRQRPMLSELWPQAVVADEAEEAKEAKEAEEAEAEAAPAAPVDGQ